MADVAAAADAVDALPLGRAGFTQQSLEAARDYLLKADPSECFAGGVQAVAGGSLEWQCMAFDPRPCEDGLLPISS